MINFFTPAANDQSLQYLQQIFGTVGGVLTGPTVSVLSSMFLTFNSIILAVAVLVVMYTIVVGLLATAQEGEFLGKKFHGLWTPIRTVIGIAALVPTPSGYCSMQIVIMWVLVQAIGAADTLWTTTTRSIQVLGGVSATATAGGTGVDTKLGQIFQGLLCAKTASISQNASSWYPSGFNYYCADSGTCTGYRLMSQPDCTTSDKGGQCKVSFGPNGSCGIMTYCNQQAACQADSSSAACIICTAQTNVLFTSVIPALTDMATYAAQADLEYQQFYYGSTDNPEWLKSNPQATWIQGYCDAGGHAKCCNASIALAQASSPSGASTPAPSGSSGCFNLPSPNQDNARPTDLNNTVIRDVIIPHYAKNGTKIFSSVDNVSFLTAIKNQYSAALTLAQMQIPLDPSQQDVMLNDAAKKGWAMAGAFYYYIAQQNNQKAQSANPELSFTGGPATDPQSEMSRYRNNSFAGSVFVTGDSNSQFSSITNNPALATLGPVFSSVNNGIFNNFQMTVSGSSAESIAAGKKPPNPVVALQSLGEGILIAIEIMYPLVLIAMVMLGVLSTVMSTEVLGTGLATGLTGVIMVLDAVLIPLILGFMGAFLVLGGLLAVYTPMIPYIIYVMGVIGWFGSTIEAMIAAPLVALGILSPSAHNHEILGKADHALMILFSIFLRPTLMIFGMISGMLLATVAITLINATYNTAVISITSTQLGAKGTGAVDILELIFFMATYVFLVLSALNKCFAMIHVIPMRVMRWIGGQGEDYGEGEALQEVKGGVSGAGAKAGEAYAASAQSPKKAMDTGTGMQKKQEELKKGSGPEVKGE